MFKEFVLKNYISRLQNTNKTNFKHTTSQSHFWEDKIVFSIWGYRTESPGELRICKSDSIWMPF